VQSVEDSRSRKLRIARERRAEAAGWFSVTPVPGSSPNVHEEDDIMRESSRDQGVIQVLLELIETQHLPRAMGLKKKVDAGERLDKYDMRFLESVFADVRQVSPLVKRHPEHEKLAATVLHLYKEIMDKAIENEKRT
jgi:hypothetical protein